MSPRVAHHALRTASAGAARPDSDWARRCLIVTIAIALGGCATGVEPESGARDAAGGSLGTSGAASGGSSGAGPSSGGSSTGGSSTGGSGGSTSTGGSSSGGTGGATGGSGGSTSTGGSSTGGSSSGGTGSQATRWTFDNDLQDWTVSYSEPASIAGMTAASWDAAAGDPANGSAKLDIAFSATSQKLDFSIALSSANLSGKTLTARVRLDSGLSGDTSNPGGAKLYVKSGSNYVYADGGWNNMDSSKGWVTLTLSVTSPSGFVQNPAQYMPSDIREIGIEFATGSSGSSYSTGHVHVDTVGY